MAVRKGKGPPLTAKDLRELNARRAAEYHALPKTEGREERRQYILRHINEDASFQERFFTAGLNKTENRELEIDLDNRIVRGVSIASDEPYLRWFGWEIMDHSAGAINLDRLNSGGAFLREHWGEQVAVCTRGYIDKNKTRVDLLFSRRQYALDELRDIADGVRCNTSCRYTIDDIKWLGTADDGEDQYLVTKSTMIHGASVSDPADFSVGFGKSLTNPNNQIEPDETRDCVEGDPACDDESCPIHFEDDIEDAAKSTGQSAKRKGSRLKTRARKPMALRRKKTTNTPVAPPAACKEGDAVCDDRDCEVHYEEADEREIEPVNHAARFRSIAEAAALGPQEKVRFLKIASEGALGDDPDEAGLKRALLADRKKHTDETSPDNEDPEVVGERNGGGSVQTGTYVQLKHIKGKDAQDARTRAYRLGQFFRGGLFGIQSARKWCKDNGIRFVSERVSERAHSESDNESGGILVPAEFEPIFVDLREEFGDFRRYANVVPMSSNDKTRPRRTGGLIAYPIGAKGSSRRITESKKKWDAINLHAKKWGVLAKYEDELDEDSVIGFADDLVGEGVYAFTETEDECGFIGDGTSEYHGITGIIPKLQGLHGTVAYIAGLVVATGTGADKWAEISKPDILKLMGRLPKYAYKRGATWHCSNAFWSEVMLRIITDAGGVTANEMQEGKRPLFMGYPVEVSQVLPQTPAVSQIPLLFGNIASGVMFGDRRGITVKQTDSNDTDFEEDVQCIKLTERFDIVVHDVGNAASALGDRKPGPIVGLITKAS